MIEATIGACKQDERTIFALATLAVTLSSPTLAAPVHVYGPGGPLPAMKEAAEAFMKAQGVEVTVTGGPTPSWIDKAKTDGDLVFSGSEP